MFLAAASSVIHSGRRLIFTESRLHSVLQTIPGYEEALAEARRK